MTAPRVVHLTLAERSGAALYVSELVRSQAAAGIEVRLVAPRGFEHIRGVEAAGVVVDATLPPIAGAGGAAAKLRVMALQSLRAVRAVVALRRWSRVVHVNFPSVLPLALVTLVLLRACRCAVVLTVHDATPHRWLFPKRLRRVERGLHRLSLRCPHLLIVHHEGAAAELREIWRIPAERVATVPHGAFDVSGPELPRPPGTGIKALCFGAIRENKGIDLAIAAVQLLRDRGADVSLSIVGRASASEASYWDRCRDLIAARPEGIEVTERYVAHDEVAGVLAAAHLVLLPYTDFHSQSGVALLALTNGRAIASTAAGGLADLVAGGVGVVEIEDASTAGVAAALGRALALGPERLLEMGEAARDAVLTLYPWDEIALRYRAVYDALPARASVRAQPGKGQ